MNKADLINSLAKEKGFIKAQTSQVVGLFFGEMTKHVAKGVTGLK